MKKILLTSIAIFIFVNLLFSQISSRNGAWITQSGDYRVFVVFVHIANHPEAYNTNTNIWQSGQIPLDAAGYFDHTYNANQQNSMLTRYIHQASFGQFHLTGDYYPDLISIDYNDLMNHGTSFFMDKVIEQININNPTDIITANGFSVNNGDFDIWQAKSSYNPSVLGSDNQLDYLIVIADNGLPQGVFAGCNLGGHARPSASTKLLGTYTFDQSFLLVNCNGLGSGSKLKHEFDHSLFGGNVPYHTGTRNGGNGTFLTNVGGYSMMGGDDETSQTFNGWDRNRLGWILPNKQFDISARNESNYVEVNTDLVYGTLLNNNGGSTHPQEDVFILRDFVTYGDAIRIEMPFVNSEKPNARPQYLWLENRQNLPGNFDQNSNASTGIYAYMQVGLEGFQNTSRDC